MNYKTARIVAVTLLAAVILAGCPGTKEGGTAAWFWPLKEGDRYVYLVTDPTIEGTHTVDIVRVRKEKNIITVLTREIYDLEIAGKADKRVTDVEYRIQGGDGSIVLIDPDAGRENIMLAGPVRTGTRWPITMQYVYKMHDEFGVKINSSKEVKGEGRIDGIERMKTVGGIERECAIVGSYMGEDPLPKLVLCRGLGIAGVVSTGADGGHMWVEKLEGFEGPVPGGAK